jgi:hypothetical protein
MTDLNTDVCNCLISQMTPLNSTTLLIFTYTVALIIYFTYFISLLIFTNKLPMTISQHTHIGRITI